MMLVSFMVACGETDIILPGERIDIRTDATTSQNETRAFSVRAAKANTAWTHRNGTPSHQIAHPALSESLQPHFVTSIGAGDSQRARITAEPVVAGGVIYTIDALSRVTATDVSGQMLWARVLSSGSDNPQDASGGGLSFADGRVFATNGFGDLTALDASSGAVLWTQDLDAPGSSAPTVMGDLVYVVGRDNTAWAIEIESGRIHWQLTGTPSSAGFAGGAGAGVTKDIAIFPFSSGDVIATFPKGGLRRWSTVVAGARPGAALAKISDIAGDPVIAGDRVYIGNVSGFLVALDLETGDRLWTAREGTVGPVWPAGDSVFLVNDQNELLRLDRRGGAVVWRVDLPDEITGRWGRVEGRFAHYGPIIAGGRLIVASSDGQIRSFDPTSGALTGTLAIEGGAASNPVVADQTLYVISKSGHLHAFR